MVSSARIDELRKKFDENPRRYFAPLANEYRKGGDLEQAIFICQEYLPQQPGHMSGHIVYGQALFELGRHDEAKVVFETALSLDPENLIALRHLGDIARAAGDVSSAHAWYQRVLEADPRNEEIAVILAEMASMPAPPPPTAASTTDEASSATAGPTSGAVSSTAPTPLTTPAIIESAEASSAALSNTEAALPLEPPPAAQASEAAARTAGSPGAGTEDHELLDLDDFDLGTTTPGPSTDLGETPPEPHIERATDIELGLPDDGTSSPAFTESATEVPAVPGLEHFERAEPGAGTPEPDPYLDLPTGDRELDDIQSPASSATPGSEFATETMAELYLRQGHAEAALDIYRTLLAQRPDDAGLRHRMAAVEQEINGSPPAVQAEAAGPTIREFLASIVNRAVGSPRASQSPPSPETSVSGAHSENAGAGQPSSEGAQATTGSPASAPPQPTSSSPSDTVSGSIDALFVGTSPESTDALAASTLADAFAPDSPETAPLRGMPAHRAASELSLDHVFRRAPDGRASGEVDRKSFDEFFSEEPPPLPTNGETSSAAESSDDVEHFNAWLNGLKKP